MNLEKYEQTELKQVREDLRAMGVSINAIDYVICSCKMAYAMGDEAGCREALGIYHERDRLRLERVHSAYRSFGDC